VLTALPDQHVDTGIGLERLVSLLQGVSSNYDSDVFRPIFRAIEGCSTEKDVVGEEDLTLRDTASRALADHVRTLSFAIANGVFPSNTGRGYVYARKGLGDGGRLELGAEQTAWLADNGVAVTDNGDEG